jgi:hypothetical protein
MGVRGAVVTGSSPHQELVAAIRDGFTYHEKWALPAEAALDSLVEQLESTQRILVEERRWISDARDWYRDHRSSKGGIYDEGTWGDPFAVPGEAVALPTSAVPSGEDVSPPVPSPASVSHEQARAALVALLKLTREDRVQCVLEDPSILDYITTLLWPADLGPVCYPAKRPT